MMTSTPIGRIPISPLERGLRNIAILTAFIYLEAVVIERVIAGPATTWYWRRIKNGRR